MKSSVTRSFRRQLSALLTEAQEQADRAYALWRLDPYHPSLQFKQVSRRQPIYSVRVGIGYRALGLREGDHVYWFWTGSHAHYDEFLKRLWRSLLNVCTFVVKVQYLYRLSPVSQE